jgi:predicted permease
MKIQARQENRMDKKYTRWILPLLILLALGLALRIIEGIMPENFQSPLSVVATAALLFMFGMFLTQHKKRSSGWFKKLLVSFIMLIIIGKRLGWIEFDVFWTYVNDLGINQTIQNAVIIYCGWIFFD